ncbi:MAG: Lrp/AsnC family transcriptional regulator [Flectobacillus sp.]|uniref:Lrp/AsnC family transcriptional regulator n=1 Tax=Flectobacillus sp. TaxID=50419 RepID=UPI003B99D2F7
MNSLDQTDLEILKLLQENAELSIKEIAHKIYKSNASVHERIRRLKENGYIKKTVAILDRRLINCNLIAFCHVLLNNHASKTLDSFENEVIKFPEVMECYQMTGTFDFILRVVTPDIDAYHDFYRNKLANLADIATVQTFFVLSEAKSETAYPI